MRPTWLIAFLTIFIFSACNKEPGEGGKAEIHGVIYQQKYNKNTGQPIGTPIPVGDHRVYIRYGTETFASNDARTEPDGTFRFPWLRKGNYVIYTYSECRPSFCDGDQFAIYAPVEIVRRKDVREVPQILVEWWK